jgi:hypothetical protein
MRRIAINFAVWIVAVISLLVIFSVTPQRSPWFWPVMIAWFTVAGTASMALRLYFSKK